MKTKSAGCFVSTIILQKLQNDQHHCPQTLGLKKKVIYRPNRHFKELLPILLEKGHRTQALPISVFTFRKFISDNDGLHSEGTHFEMTQTFPLKLGKCIV